MKAIGNQLLLAICLTLSLGTSHHLHGQNAMDFDGVDDQMTVPNASALIANSNMSLSLWVYPTNAAAGWPDFDGLAGFRNDVDADFYLAQLSATNVEARFRGSSGIAYDISFNGLQINTWNHLVLTYDGTTLSLYHNGSLFGSAAASGAIANTTSTFRMGMLPYSFNEFYLDGQLEDVGLWSKSLSANEVDVLYNSCSMDLSDMNLELCYEFNQGVGGGNNTGVTSAIDSKGNIDATMTGFTLMGNTSNFIPHDNAVTNTISESATCTYTSPSGNYTWTNSGTFMDTLTAVSGCDSILTINLTVLPVAGQTITETACQQYTGPSGNYTWTSSGQYTDTLQASTGCDSVVTIDLTINTVDVSVTSTSPTLTANAIGATYLWLDCDNNLIPISGETSQSFTATTNGNYAVEVTENGCSDTSACFIVANVGIGEYTNNAAEIIRVTDLLGRETTPVPNRPLLYYYSDGTVKRVMKLEE